MSFEKGLEKRIGDCPCAHRKLGVSLSTHVHDVASGTGSGSCQIRKGRTREEEEEGGGLPRRVVKGGCEGE